LRYLIPYKDLLELIKISNGDKVPKEITTKDLIDNSLSEFQLFSNMLSKTVHDINNPLAVLIGQLSIVDILKEQDKLTPEKMDKILEKINSSTVTFKERLDHLRSFYKIPLNDKDYQSVNQVCYSVIYYLDKMAFQNDINISLSIDEEIKTAIPADKLFIVVKNLVQNSIETLISTSKQGGAVYITVKKNETGAELSVEDTGPGLVCDLDMAIELGYTTMPHPHKGHGLGVASFILEEYNSQLQYSAKDRTKFWMELPNS
jgi:signal transduction histidine kinase